VLYPPLVIWIVARGGTARLLAPGYSGRLDQSIPRRARWRCGWVESAPPRRRTSTRWSTC